MWFTCNIVAFLACLWVVLASSFNETEPRASCTVTSYSKVAEAVASCSEIVLDGITVPAETTLDIALQDGAELRFQNEIKFEYAAWDGPLIKISGRGITVLGLLGHSLDGQGSKYWDGKGDGGGKAKPKFFRIEATGGSLFQNINLNNCPKHCVTIANSDSLTLTEWNIDVSAGDSQGKNTDGFDIASSNNIVIENSVVKNQDDCVAVNHGTNMKFSGLTCVGGHGLSLSVGKSKTDASANVVSNIVFTNCTVENSRNGIHVKTHSDATTGITRYGINIQEDYEEGSSTGNPKGNIPITALTMQNIEGTMAGSDSIPVYILCGTDGCAEWSWSSISITGNDTSNYCNYTPDGFTC
ncbi:hypothetical protein NQ318_012730 [Aromia moschata]|uniref:endo-polygalacturonase n=1 Tax=Aromia moschata TaxID=1265417 RepID=A0AAV8XPY3_9CUCU|nr:hypothetical protein NQ318_012730 [Aromia moschata]